MAWDDVQTSSSSIEFGEWNNMVTYIKSGISAEGVIASTASADAGIIDSGNLDISVMPTGGAWSLSSDLNIDSDTFVIDQTNDRVGIGLSNPSYDTHIKSSNPTVALEGSTSGNPWRLETSATNNVFNITETGVGSPISIAATTNNINLGSGTLYVDTVNNKILFGGTSTNSRRAFDYNQTITLTDPITMAFRPVVTAGGGSTEAITFNFAGSIGTASSGTYTEILGTRFTEPNITVNGSAAVTKATTVQITSAPTEATDNFYFEVGSDVFMIKNDGTVGIGTDTPLGLLNVTGTEVHCGYFQSTKSDGATNSIYAEASTSNTGDNRAAFFTATNGGAGNAYGLIVNAGNVGFGTTAPGQKLTLAESTAGTSLGLQITHSDNTNTGSDARLLLQTGGSSGGDPFVQFSENTVNWYAGIDNADSNSFKISDSQWGSGFVITTDDEIGFGTSTPSTQVDIITGTSTDSSFHIGEVLGEGMYMDSVTDQHGRIEIGSQQVAGNSIARAITAVSFGAYGGGNFLINTDDSLTDGNVFTPTERMRIDSSGNIGFGTSTPATVNGNAKTGTFLQLDSSANSGGIVVEGATRGEFHVLDAGASANQKHWMWATDNGGLQTTRINDAGSETITTFIDTSGNMAIGDGNFSPNQKLTVDGSISLEEQASANADTAAYGQLWVKNDAPNTLWFTDDAGTDFQLGAGAGATKERKLEGEVYTTTFLPIVIPDALGGKDVSEVRITLGGVPTGADFKVDVRKNGTATTDSIFTSDAEIEIATGASTTNGVYQSGCDTSGSTVGTAGTTIDSAEDAVVADDILWVVITQVGSTFAGSDFTCTLTIE